MTMELLITCAKRMGSQLAEGDRLALQSWWAGQRARSHGLFTRLLALPDLDAESAIADHRAHRHRWYEQLADEVSIEEFASFLLENGWFPPFLPLALARGAAGRARDGAARVPELQPLRAPLSEAASVALRAARGMRDARAELEELRTGARRGAAEARE